MPGRFQSAIDRGKLASEALLPELERIWRELLADWGAHAASRFSSLTAAGSSTWVAPTWSELAPVTTQALDAVGKTAVIRAKMIEAAMLPALVEFGISFDVSNPLVDGVFQQTGKKITHVSETQRAITMRAVEDARLDGLSIPDTAKLLRARTSGSYGLNRAKTIARTELIGLQNGGSLAAAKLVGIETKQWVATGDNRTRPSHRDADGQTVNVNDFFNVGVDLLSFPGDPNGSANEVINCRCTLAYDDNPSGGAPAKPIPGLDPVSDDDASGSALGLDQAVKMAEEHAKPGTPPGQFHTFEPGDLVDNQGENGYIVVQADPYLPKVVVQDVTEFGKALGSPSFPVHFSDLELVQKAAKFDPATSEYPVGTKIYTKTNKQLIVKADNGDVVVAHNVEKGYSLDLEKSVIAESGGDVKVVLPGQPDPYEALSGLQPIPELLGLKKGQEVTYLGEHGWQIEDFEAADETFYIKGPQGQLIASDRESLAPVTTPPPVPVSELPALEDAPVLSFDHPELARADAYADPLHGDDIRVYMRTREQAAFHATARNNRGYLQRRFAVRTYQSHLAETLNRSLRWARRERQSALQALEDNPEFTDRLANQTRNDTAAVEQWQSRIASAKTEHERLAAERALDEVYGNMVSPDARTFLRELDQAFEEAPPLGQAIKVYRGTGNFLRERDLAALVGDVFQDDAYMSTAWSGEFGGSIKWEITVPAGTRVIDVQAISREMGEQEILLPRGSRFLVDRVEGTPGRWVVHARMLPADA